MSKKKAGLVILIVLGLVLIAGRLYLPYWLTGYVNREIAALDGYGGSVRDVDVFLWRGAYQIDDLKIHKEKGGLKEPFVAAKTVDLALEWGALIHGAVVAEIDIYKADLNFSLGQTGEGVDWTGFVDALSPLDINRLDIHSGRVAYINYAADPNVNVYIDGIDAKITNLRQVRDKNNPLPSTVSISGTSIGNGDIHIDGRVNILKKIPDFDLAGKLESASLTAFNDYTRSFAGVDFESGTIGVYSELAASNGKVIGYVKPVATDISVVDLESNDDDVFDALWESAISLFIEIFENQPKDQFAMRIPIRGDLNSMDKDGLSAFFSIFQNAFGGAFSRDTDGNIDFDDALEQSN